LNFEAFEVGFAECFCKRLYCKVEEEAGEWVSLPDSPYNFEGVVAEDPVNYYRHVCITIQCLDSVNKFLWDVEALESFPMVVVLNFIICLLLV
jgi:hypothetical protein